MASNKPISCEYLSAKNKVFSCNTIDNGNIRIDITGNFSLKKHTKLDIGKLILDLKKSDQCESYISSIYFMKDFTFEKIKVATTCDGAPVQVRYGWNDWQTGEMKLNSFPRYQDLESNDSILIHFVATYKSETQKIEDSPYHGFLEPLKNYPFVKEECNFDSKSQIEPYCEQYRHTRTGKPSIIVRAFYVSKPGVTNFSAILSEPSVVIYSGHSFTESFKPFEVASELRGKYKLMIFYACQTYKLYTKVFDEFYKNNRDVQLPDLDIISYDYDVLYGYGSSVSRSLMYSVLEWADLGKFTPFEEIIRFSGVKGHSFDTLKH